MERLKNKLNEILPLPSPEMDLLISAWTLSALPKSHVILPQGGTCKHIYFVGQGSIRCFELKEGKEVTEWIAIDEALFYPPISLFQQQPSRLCIQTVEATDLYAIHVEDLERLCESSHAIEKFYRHLLMNGILDGERRIESLMSGSAQQRYIHLSSKYPDLLKRIPLSYIASYIGVTQETLSRIRGMRNII